VNRPPAKLVAALGLPLEGASLIVRAPVDLRDGFGVEGVLDAQGEADLARLPEPERTAETWIELVARGEPPRTAGCDEPVSVGECGTHHRPRVADVARITQGVRSQGSSRQ